MKRPGFVLFMFLLIGSCMLNAQAGYSQFLFADFQDACVYFKPGYHSKEKVNYNLLSNNFAFIDKQSGEIKNVSNVKEITVLEIGERVFYPDKNGWIEVFPTTPVVYVQYRAKAAPEAIKGVYGGSTETSSVQSYGSIYADNRLVELNKREIKLQKRYNVYWVEKNGNKKEFRTFKQFVRIYSDHKDKLNEFIQENKINFEDVEAITKFCIYAGNL